MTLFDWIVLEVAIVISYFGGIAYALTLMIAGAVIILYRVVKGERIP